MNSGAAAGGRATRRLLLVAGLLGGALLAAGPARAADYHVDPVRGDDGAAGSGPDRAWRTLARASRAPLKAGDRLLLRGGETHRGRLHLAGFTGTAGRPIVVTSYEPEAGTLASPAVVDGRGEPAAVHVVDCRYVQISNLVVTADGGGWAVGEPSAGAMRCGVLVEAVGDGNFGGIELRRLHVRDVSFEEPGFVQPAGDVRTANGAARYGWGIRFIVQSPRAGLHGLSVRDCRIERVDHTGLRFTAPAGRMSEVRVTDVQVAEAGGPGVQFSGVTGVRCVRLDVDRSGSTRDTRNWGRGSGLWTWGSSDVVVEYSRFTNAHGPGDSAGVHIDYNCRDVVIQYNLSRGNAGGFAEILGNNHNCAYRYNVSIDDGHRVKGRDGAFQEGKTLWLSGYVGQAPRQGPFNTYFYNNTIYVGEGIEAKVAVGPTASGVLIANNIFHLVGPSRTVAGDQNRPDQAAAGAIPRVVFTNNLYLRADNWPPGTGLEDRAPILGDARFLRPGGGEIGDYQPEAAELVRDRGIPIPHLPEDAVGLAGGLTVTADILGNPVVGAPDLGAIEISP